MNEWTARLSELTRAIKAPKYFIIGLVILFIALVLLPVLKLLAIVFSGLLIFIGFYPDHRVSKQVIYLLKKLN